MIEIYPQLYIGSDDDAIRWNGVIIRAARDPWFKNLNLPKDHLWNETETALTLNLVDADNVSYIPIPLIDRALDFINEKITKKRVLVHCNQGHSRAPSIGFLYLLKYTDLLKNLSFEEAVEKYKTLYSWWTPNRGMALFCVFYYRKLSGVL